ncbi:hypothetical protein D3C87_1265650 [compost metagenome]
MIESKVPIDLIHAGEQIQKRWKILFLDDVLFEIGLSHFENGFGYIGFHILNLKALHFLNSDKSFIQGYRREIRPFLGISLLPLRCFGLTFLQRCCRW